MTFYEFAKSQKVDINNPFTKAYDISVLWQKYQYQNQSAVPSGESSAISNIFEDLHQQALETSEATEIEMPCPCICHNNSNSSSCKHCNPPLSSKEDWDECYCMCHGNTNSGVLCGHCQSEPAISDAESGMSGKDSKEWEEAFDQLEIWNNRPAQFKKQLKDFIKTELDKARKEEQERVIEIIKSQNNPHVERVADPLINIIRKENQ